MTRFTVGTLLVFGVAAAAADRPPAPAETLRAIKQDQQKFEQKLAQEYEQAKTDAERNKFFEARRKDMQSCARRALALARHHPKDPATFDALEWVITGGLGYFPETWQALDLVRRDYLTYPRLSKICQHAQIYRTEYAGTETLLRDVLEKNPDRKVQGVACFALATALQDYAAWAKRLRDPATAKALEKFYRERDHTAGLIEKIKASDPARLRKESERFYELTAKKYGDVKSPGGKRTLAQRANAALFEMHHLQVGRRVPEIEGEDIDGKKFKLSDYRGKVVVLDFWGNW
jgi:hypothetical protein